MSAVALLDTLQRRGISARIEGGDLKLKPVASLDSALLDSLCDHKAELVKLLQLESASRATSSTQILPPLPLSLVGIPGIEYSIECRSWIRRTGEAVGEAVWLVPLLANADAQTNTQPFPDTSKALAFDRAVRRIQREINPGLRRVMTEEELHEYSLAAARGIDFAKTSCLVSAMADKTEPTTKNN